MIYSLLLRNKFRADYIYDQIYNKVPPIYYGKIHKGMIPNPPYEFISNNQILYKRLNEFISIYNSKNKTAPMDVIFYHYFVAHISKVCRILRHLMEIWQNMISIGHGGSGKKLYAN